MGLCRRGVSRTTAANAAVVPSVWHFAPLYAVWDFAPFGASRRSGFRAVNEYALRDRVEQLLNLGRHTRVAEAIGCVYPLLERVPRLVLPAELRERLAEALPAVAFVVMRGEVCAIVLGRLLEQVCLHRLVREAEMRERVP